MSYRGPADFAKETDPALRALGSLVRRLLVSVTKDHTGAAAGIWQMLGGLISGATREVIAAVEVWQGIGFASRPRPTSKAEAIVIALGAVGNALGGSPQAVALRDEDLRKLAASDLADDETAIFTSKAIVRIKADGTIEIRSLGGTAASLALKSELDTLKSAISGAATVPNDGGAAFKTNILAALAGWPVGTTKLKGE